MLAIANFVSHRLHNLYSLEMWGGATFDVTMRFLHEDPFSRLRKLREAVPNICFQMLLRASNAVGYTAYPDNVVAEFIYEAAAQGIDIFRIFDSLNWLEGMQVSIRAVKERTGGLAEACICYTGDFLDPERNHKFNLQYYIDLAKRLEDAGAHMLGIKDMAGLLKPMQAGILVSELKKAIDIPIHLHTHDTSSIQAATYLKAIEAGVDVVDVALASMSGLTSQPNFNSIVAMMKGHPREQPVNLHKLNELSNYWEDVREFYYPFESQLKAGTAEVTQSQRDIRHADQLIGLAVERLKRRWPVLELRCQRAGLHLLEWAICASFIPRGIRLVTSAFCTKGPRSYSSATSLAARTAHSHSGHRPSPRIRHSQGSP
jgi:pyruvate carboxylase